MATQWITIAKVGGMAANVVAERLRDWSAARKVEDPNEWSSDQWPTAVRQQADEFADRLLANGHVPPVVHMVQWVDMWLMGDAFPKWLTPPGWSGPNIVFADRYEIFGYTLPDAGRLARHLAGAGPQQFTESDWLVP